MFQVWRLSSSFLHPCTPIQYTPMLAQNTNLHSAPPRPPLPTTRSGPWRPSQASALEHLQQHLYTSRCVRGCVPHHRHRTMADAHVRPAPKPANAKTWPSLMSPEPTASASARGMDAALVLPYSARLLTTCKARCASLQRQQHYSNSITTATASLQRQRGGR